MSQPMPQPAPQAVATHPTFDLLRTERIGSLNMDVQQFQHAGTGAMHYHLAANNSENVFLVALRTVPQDSTGVAHILEHTALCGSERFPVRDPFFLMLRRSLNTFMNAFTSSDWTAYPFASQNPKDFDNLLRVYLDAVFFSRLDPLDFAQEGHRLEFDEPDNPDSDLLFKGVVFNEMKGAMSSVSSALWHRLCHHLFPSTTYHYNSGGEPACIPDLSYEQLLDFYRTHYHPSNAIFMTFGDIPAASHQRAFEELALSRFERLDTRISVPPEQRLAAPVRVRESYAFDDPGSDADKTHIVMAWLLGDSFDLEQQLEARLLSSVLLDNSASPLQQALETTELGHAPSPLCGLEESMREMVFACGIEGSEADRAEDLEALVLGVLERLADSGVDRERLDAALHQLELHQREISGDSYPYGLELILTALGCATHHADPIAALNLEPVLDTLRSRCAEPDYIKNLARRLLLDNPHRVTLVMTPDKELSARRLAEEAARLDRIRASMDGDAVKRVLDNALALAERQAMDDDESILPKVELADVRPDIPDLEPTRPESGGFPCTRYAQGTNGLVYQQVVVPLPDLDDRDIEHLPYHTSVLTELGLGEQDYLAVQNRQSAICGGISAVTALRGKVTDQQDTQAYFVLSSKALARNHREQSSLMRDTLHSARFDELARIRDLVSQTRARREQTVTGNGHHLAMTAASCGLSPVAAINHRLSGLEGIRRCKRLDDALDEDAELERFAHSLQRVHDRIAGGERQFMLVADGEQLDAVLAGCESAWGEQVATGETDTYSPAPMLEPCRSAWLTNTQVNFCAQAFPTVPVDHEDAAALAALGVFLRNGYLHTAIREKGGAYGGGAIQDSNIGAFRFFSYRDPRLEDTLEDFGLSVRWMLDTSHSEDALEQAVLGVIGGLDKPSSPAGEARQHFNYQLFGRTLEQRLRFRQRVLGLRLDDLRRVCETYLQPERASIAVITSHATLEQVERLGLAVEEL